MATLSPRAALAQLLQSSSFQRFEADLARVSAFHVLGIDRRELSHAALLGWLLNPRAGHGLGAHPLRSFLMLSCGLGDSEGTGPDAVDIDGLDLHGAQVDLEFAVRDPGTGRPRRIDMLVSVPHGEGIRPILLVEYKVDGAETEDQTVAYARWASEEATKNRWPTEPMLVYLCPGQGQPASERFVVVDYDAYLPWLESLDSHRPSATAQFLLQEFRACLWRREDVQGERQKQLLDAVLESESDAIDALKRAGTRADLQSVVSRHKEALNALGLFRSRQHKGYSAFVVAVRQVLLARLENRTWHLAGGDGCLVAVYLPSVDALRDQTGEERGPSAALRIHLFMERPRKHRARAVLEVVGNHPQLDAVDSKHLRMKLAKQLRERFGSRFDQETSGQIVGAFVLEAPGVVGPEDDTETATSKSSGQLEGFATRVAALGEALREWTSVLRAELAIATSKLS